MSDTLTLTLLPSLLLLSGVATAFSAKSTKPIALGTGAIGVVVGALYVWTIAAGDVGLYAVAGFGALACAGSGRHGRAISSGVACLGLLLLLSLFVGEVPTRETPSGPLLLLLTNVVALGCCASFGLRVCLEGGRQVALVTGLGLLLSPLLVPVAGVGGVFGVGHTLVADAGPVYLISAQGLLQRVVMRRAEIGLALMTTGFVLSLGLLLGGPAILAQRRRMRLVLIAAVSGLVATMGWLLAAPGGSVAGIAELEHMTQLGRLAPMNLDGLTTDRVSLLPVCAAWAGFIACAYAAGSGSQRPNLGAVDDMSLAFVIGLGLVSALSALWREVWGAPLVGGVSSAVLALCVLAALIRFTLGRKTTASYGTAVLLVLASLLLQMPAGFELVPS